MKAFQLFLNQLIVFLFQCFTGVFFYYLYLQNDIPLAHLFAIRRNVSWTVYMSYREFVILYEREFCCKPKHRRKFGRPYKKLSDELCVCERIHVALFWVYYKRECKGKVISLRAWTGPEVSRKLRFPNFVTMAQDVGKVVSLTHRPALPPGNIVGTHFC